MNAAEKKNEIAVLFAQLPKERQIEILNLMARQFARRNMKVIHGGKDPGAIMDNGVPALRVVKTKLPG